MATLTFLVRRKEPVLVGPAAPTPHETKRLSDIDNREFLRMHLPFVWFYRGVGLHGGVNRDPASVIRRALGEVLVPYYPLAGRLREVEARKLVVDCTGDGVLFVEADADVRLAELEAAAGLRPPFPCMDQLLFDVEGSGGVLNCPLLLIQVTRLLCGGFVLALRFNHTICDGEGLAQFLSAVAEHARGNRAPTVVPAWSRELLEARKYAKPSFLDAVAVPQQQPQPPPPGDMVMRTFTFGSAAVTAIKKGLPPHIRDSTTSFEALTAVLWRARTAALELPADEVVTLMAAVNVRRRLPELALPNGYYGNASVGPMVVKTAGALMAGSLGDAVELVRNAKTAVTVEYVQSMLVNAGRLSVALANLYLVSDIRHAGFHRVDFGWGEPVYGGPAGAWLSASHLVAVKNGGGEEAIAVPVTLPRPAMDRFASEVEMFLS